MKFLLTLAVFCILCVNAPAQVIYIQQQQPPVIIQQVPPPVLIQQSPPVIMYQQSVPMITVEPIPIQFTAPAVTTTYYYGPRRPLLWRRW